MDLKNITMTDLKEKLATIDKKILTFYLIETTW